MRDDARFTADPRMCTCGGFMELIGTFTTEQHGDQRWFGFDAKPIERVLDRLPRSHPWRNDARLNVRERTLADDAPTSGDAWDRKRAGSGPKTQRYVEVSHLCTKCDQALPRELTRTWSGELPEDVAKSLAAMQGAAA